jgi:hypothetical protein
MVASAHMNKNANSGKTTVHYVLSSIHTGEISFIIFFLKKFELKYKLSLEPTTPSPVTVASQSSFRQVIQEAIDFTMLATPPPKGN